MFVVSLCVAGVLGYAIYKIAESVRAFQPGKLDTSKNIDDVITELKSKINSIETNAHNKVNEAEGDLEFYKTQLEKAEAIKNSIK
jgi:hypothetical protein